MAFNKIIKNCDCGNVEYIEKTDEVLQEIKGDGMAVVYCSQCGLEIYLYCEDIEDADIYEDYNDIDVDDDNEYDFSEDLDDDEY